MSRVDAIEREVRALSADELARFRRWFQEFDAASWDQQVSEDVQSGKLDSLAAEALHDHRTGKSKEL